jgi:hypothetical protein
MEVVSSVSPNSAEEITVLWIDTSLIVNPISYRHQVISFTHQI